MPYCFFLIHLFWNGVFYFEKALPGKYGKQRYWQLPRRWMKVFPFVVFSTWLKKAIVLTVCLYKIKDCETSVKENLTIIQPGMLHRRRNKSPPAGRCWFTGLTSETPYMGMLYRWRVGAWNHSSAHLSVSCLTSRNHNKQRELFFSSVCGLGDMPATHVNV